MSQSDDGTIDINLRQPADIAARMTILLATSLRESMEYGEEDETDAYGSETDRFDLYAWIRSAYGEALTSAESAFLAAPIGTPDDDTILEFSMDGMAACALGWSLGLVDQIPFTDRVGPVLDRLRDTTLKPWDRPEVLLKRVQPRPEPQVWQERERWELLRIRFLMENVEDEGDRRDALADLEQDAQGLGMPVRDGDVLIGDRPVAHLDDDEFAMIGAGIDATVRALTWACGIGGDWDDVTADIEID